MIIYASRDSGYSLDRFVGKDLWVKVDIKTCVSANETWWSTYLIRIISATNDCYIYNKIHDCLNNHRDHTWHCNSIQYQNALDNSYRSGKDRIKLSKPVEAYSTEELFTIVR